jgi:hypothetical protein
LLFAFGISKSFSNRHHTINNYLRFVPKVNFFKTFVP